jgi:DNA-binding CsgD family transcriptional regulator
MIRNVIVNQLWELNANPFSSDRILTRVVAVEKSYAYLEVLVRGGVKRATRVSFRTLRHGLRGARLVRNADGSEPAPEPPEAIQRNPWATPETPRKGARRPRGVLGPLSKRQLQIERLVGRGVPMPEIARRLGISTMGVRRARDAIANRREAEEMGLVK